jgi:hypothetical protein
LNPKKFAGYNAECWGLTASYFMIGYAAHSPGETNDPGVISPIFSRDSKWIEDSGFYNGLKREYCKLEYRI